MSKVSKNINMADPASTNNQSSVDKETTADGLRAHPQMSHEEEQVARAAARFGYGPLANIPTNEARLPAFGGEFQPGLYRPVESRKIANPAPMGLCGFALTTFVLGCINMGTRDINSPSIVIGLAFGYGGLVQLLAGMWEMAAGNTFGATAFASYGGFWISFAIIIFPGANNVIASISDTDPTMALNSLGLYLAGWFIFTFILLLCTLRSTVAFFLLFFTLDMAFLLLSISYLQPADGGQNPKIEKAGGFFALLSAFLAWYNALAGIADSSNSFFIIPVFHFPWSEKGRVARNEGINKTERETV